MIIYTVHTAVPHLQGTFKCVHSDR